MTWQMHYVEKGALYNMMLLLPPPLLSAHFFLLLPAKISIDPLVLECQVCGMHTKHHTLAKELQLQPAGG